MHAFKHRRLSHITCFSDTAKPESPSYGGNKYFQITTNHFGLLHVYCLKSKDQAHLALKKFVEKFGIPGTMLTDNAWEQHTGEWGKICNTLVIKQCTTEPHTPKQNRAEREIQDVVKNGNRLMHQHSVPKCFWDHAYQFYADLCNHIAIPREILRGRTPLEMTTGDTPDVSKYIAFHFYQPIWYHQPTAKYPSSKAIVGRWLGPAPDVGQLLCYKILLSNVRLVVRSTVKALDTSKPTQAAALAAYDCALHARIRFHNVDPSIDPIVDDTDTTELLENLEYLEVDETIIPPPPPHKPELDNTIGSQIYFQRGNAPPSIGKVIGCKRDANGELVGRTPTATHPDTRIYLVRFTDGTTEELLYNTIIKNLYSRCDKAGKRHLVLKKIVGHTKPQRNQRNLHRWTLQVQWKDDTITDKSVDVMQENYLYEVAKYLNDNGLANEPPFT